MSLVGLKRKSSETENFPQNRRCGIATLTTSTAKCYDGAFWKRFKVKIYRIGQILHFQSVRMSSFQSAYLIRGEVLKAAA